MNSEVCGQQGTQAIPSRRKFARFSRGQRRSGAGARQI